MRRAGRGVPATPPGLLVAGALVLLVSLPALADSYAAIGFGIVHTDGTAYQAATRVYGDFELHFTSWNGDDHSQASASATGGTATTA